MSLNIRQAVRNAIKAVMADAVTGFNAKFLALHTGLPPQYDLSTYDTAEMVLDFTAPSKNFVFQQLQWPDGVDFSQLSGPLTMTVYTTRATGNGPKFATYAGEVVAHADFFVHLSNRRDSADEIERDDTESLLDCIEQAALEVMTQNIDWEKTYGVVFDGRPFCERPPIRLTDDGWAALIPIQFAFEIDV